MSEVDIQARKTDHIEVAASGNADFRAKSTLLEEVTLHHQSLPELAFDDIDLRTSFLGHTLEAPLLITGMTGGTSEAEAINRDLAEAAQEEGIALGLGSQRAMAEKPELGSTYAVRDVAPDAFLLGNIGAVQARAYGVPRIQELAQAVGANAMAVHLNPAQEMIQGKGDRDFRGVLSFVGQLAAELPIPVIVKETGCGISKQAAIALKSEGIRAVDVSGAGGTSWVAVEQQRAGEGSEEQSLGSEYWDWGIPTAVSVAYCAAQGLEVVASGGIRSGLDIARSIALGAKLGGIAAPALRAQRDKGRDGVTELIRQYKRSIRVAHLLTGSKNIEQLRNAPRHVGPRLGRWIDELQ